MLLGVLIACFSMRLFQALLWQKGNPEVNYITACLFSPTKGPRAVYLISGGRLPTHVASPAGRSSSMQPEMRSKNALSELSVECCCMFYVLRCFCTNNMLNFSCGSLSLTSTRPSGDRALPSVWPNNASGFADSCQKGVLIF